jgi:hypothetical protein
MVLSGTRLIVIGVRGLLSCPCQWIALPPIEWELVTVPTMHLRSGFIA